MIKKSASGTSVKSEKGKYLDTFSVVEVSSGFAVRNGGGKIYTVFDTHSKASRYSEYLAHTQLASVEYYKHLRKNADNDLLQEFSVTRFPLRVGLPFHTPRGALTRYDFPFEADVAFPLMTPEEGELIKLSTETSHELGSFNNENM